MKSNKRPNQIIIRFNYENNDVKQNIIKNLKKFLNDKSEPMSSINEDDNISIFWR